MALDFTKGLAFGSSVIRDLAANIRDGIDYYLEESDPNEAKYGDISDIISSVSEGVSLNGVDALREEIPNVAVFGATGALKSAGCLIPTALRARDANYVIYDSTGQIAELTKAHFYEMGFDCFLLDYSNPLKGSCVNFFDCMKGDQEVHKTSALLHYSSGEGSRSDPFFLNSAINLTSWLIRLLKCCDPMYHNFANVVHCLNGVLTKDIKYLVARVATEKLFQEYKAFCANGSDKTVGSIIAQTQAGLQFWTDDAICRMTSKNSFDWDFRKGKKRVIFIGSSTIDSHFFRPLVSCTIELMLQSLMREVPDENARKTFFLLDETSTLNLASLPKVIANTRKYRIYNALFYQDYHQVFFSGKERGHDILANCTKLFYSAQDYETSRLISDLAGKRTIRDNNGKSHRVPLLDAQEITRFKKHEGLAICKNVPYKFRIEPWFDQPLLKRKAKHTDIPWTNSKMPDRVPLIPFK